MIKITHPKILYAGDEIVCPSIEIAPSKDTLRVSFHWGDDYIKVIGANMLEPNIFEFPPANTRNIWFLKYTVSQDTQPAEKTPYITVEVVKTNKFKIKIIKFISIMLIIIPIIISILKAFNSNILSSINFDISIGSLVFSFPLALFILIFFWSKKYTELITRLSTIKEEKKLDYNGKAFSLEKILILPARQLSSIPMFNSREVESYETHLDAREKIDIIMRSYKGRYIDVNDRESNFVSKSIRYSNRRNSPKPNRVINKLKNMHKHIKSYLVKK